MSEPSITLAARWRKLARRFPAWRMPLELIFDVDSWRLYGADLLTLMAKSKKVRAACAELEGASDEVLKGLAEMAQVNVERTGEIFKTVLLTYVSIPLAAAAMLSEAAPAEFGQFVRANARAIGVIVLSSIIFPALYFCGAWRAKQIAWTIALFRAGALVPPESRPPPPR